MEFEKNRSVTATLNKERMNDLTPRAFNIILYAVRDAEQEVTCFHLLQSIINFGQGVALTIIKRLAGEQYESFERRLDEIIKNLSSQVPSKKEEGSRVSIWDRVAHLVLMQAKNEAYEMECAYVGSEHLLLALLLKGGEASQFLSDFQISYEDVKKIAPTYQV